MPTQVVANKAVAAWSQRQPQLSDVFTMGYVIPDTRDSPHAVGMENADLLYAQQPPNCLAPVVSSLMRWNCRSLLNACETLLKRSDCTLHLARIASTNVTAQNSFTWVDDQASNIRLTVDPAQASLVEGFLHEALHVVLAKEFGAFNEVLEEEIVRAIEQHLWRKTFRREDTNRWRRLINGKLR